jgi:hypothetical protein
MDLKSKGEIKKLIADNNLQIAIDSLFSIFDYHKNIGNNEIDSYYDNFILISLRFKNVVKEISLNLIDNESANISKSKIAFSILELINPIPDRIFLINRQNSINNGVKKDFEYDIFLSFASKDLNFAKSVCQQLQNYGYSIFFSEENLKEKNGKSFFTEIEKSLMKSKNFLLLCTNNSMNSGWVRAEYETYFNEIYIKDESNRHLFILCDADFDKLKLPLLLKRFQISKNINDLIKTISNRL